MSNRDEKLDECGCCDGVKPLTPALVANLPGLTALAYRVGVHGSFKETMLSGLSGRAPLRALTTRDDDDPAIALLDGWATVLDVLSFYQERIANEGYLRTATERRSILEMARSIGYELGPGVAAGTYLAFALETAPGAPPSAKIPIGTRAQSTPAQDELPQTFETIDEIVARGAWNELKPATSKPSPPAKGDPTLYLKGTSTNLKVGDALLVIEVPTSSSESPIWNFRRAKSVTPIDLDDEDTSYTSVALEESLDAQFTVNNSAKVYALRQRAALFGHNAPDWRAMPDSLKAGYLGVDPNPASVHDAVKDILQWPGFTIGIAGPPPGTSSGTGLFGEYYDTPDLQDRKATRIDATIDFDFRGGSPHPNIDADTFSIRWTGWVQARTRGQHIFSVVADDGVRLWIDGKLIINEWHDQGATEHPSPPVQLDAGNKYEITLEYYERTGFASVKLFWSPPGAAREIIPATQLYSSDLHQCCLDAIYPQILAGSWVVLGTPEREQVFLVTEVAEDSRADFTLSSKTSRLTLDGEDLREHFNDRVRDTAVFAQNEELALAERPIVDDVGGNSIDLSTPVEGLPRDRFVAISGVETKSGKPFSEVLALDPKSTTTKLVFASSLARAYKRDSVTINANVARATHGETREEVLGSGDGSQPFQHFDLKEKPLTHVSAPTASGGKSTLEVRVNDVLWDPASNFYRLPPGKRSYATRIADDGAVTVQFGDGTTGARLPTGAENVTAKYRVGIGVSAMLAAGQINLLMTRPLGVEGVTNPLAPTGAEDPERLDQARQNAPLTVLTLDRIVSLQDFEDFASAFGGIGKAQATWLWDGENRLVHLTIAGVGGGDAPSSSDLYKNLARAIDAARHADQRVRIDSYDSLEFNVEAGLLIDRQYLFENVKAAVGAALIEAFSFKNRFFGQAVTASEVIAIAQSVKGVTAVDLDKLFSVIPPAALPASRTGQLIAAIPAVISVFAAIGTPKAQIGADIAHWDRNRIAPAQLLTINPAGIKLTEIKQ